MPVSRNNKKYTAPNNGHKPFTSYNELLQAANNWCNNINKDAIIASHGHISNWKFSKKIYSMYMLFYNQETFDEDLSKWNVSGIYNMNNMFRGCVSFTGKGLEKWNVSWLHLCHSMFNGCDSLICDLSKWKVFNVEICENMFWGCSNFNSDLSNWNVQNIKYANGMFNGCTQFNSDLSKWNVCELEESNHMFNGCINLKSDFNQWNIKKLSNCNGMFNNTHISFYSVFSWMEQNPVLFNKQFSHLNPIFCSIYLLYPFIVKCPNNVFDIAFAMDDFREYLGN